MKKYIITGFLLYLFTYQGAVAQIGIGTETPHATLDIKLNTDGKAEGLITPNLTRDQLIKKSGSYTAAHSGAIVYITQLNGTVNSSTTNIDRVGYYYLDNLVWKPFYANHPTKEPWYQEGVGSQATDNNQKIYQTGSVAVGSNSAGTYKFQVTGTSNVTGNARTATSTVVGDKNVGSTFAVTGASTLNSTLTTLGATSLESALRTDGATTLKSTLAVAETSHFLSRLGIGQAPGNSRTAVLGDALFTGTVQASNVRIGDNPWPETIGVDGYTYVDGNVGIQLAENPSTKLHISTDDGSEEHYAPLKIQDGAEAEGMVLVSDDEGVGTWATPGFTDFTRMNLFTSGDINVSSTKEVYDTGFSFKLSKAGRYYVTLSGRITATNSFDRSNLAFLLTQDNDVSEYPGNRFDGAYLVNVATGNLSFYINQIIETTADDDIVYLLMSVFDPKTTTITIRTGHGAYDTSGGFVRVK